MSIDLITPQQQQQAIATAPKMSIIGELTAAALTLRMLAFNSRRAAPWKRDVSQRFHAERLDDPVAVMVSCRMFWISASLSCPLRVVVRTRRPTRPAEKTMKGTNTSEHPGELAAQGHDHRRR